MSYIPLIFKSFIPPAPPQLTVCRSCIENSHFSPLLSPAKMLVFNFLLKQMLLFDGGKHDIVLVDKTNTWLGGGGLSIA